MFRRPKAVVFLWFPFKPTKKTGDFDKIEQLVIETATVARKDLMTSLGSRRSWPKR